MPCFGDYGEMLRLGTVIEEINWWWSGYTADYFKLSNVAATKIYSVYAMDETIRQHFNPVLVNYSHFLTLTADTFGDITGCL